MAAPAEGADHAAPQLSAGEDESELQGESVLQTIAEISVAFAGFTGVVVAFGRRSNIWSRIDLLQFRAMLGTSLQALLFSVLPFLLYYSGVREERLWHLLSGLLLIGIAVGAAIDTYQIRRLPDQQWGRFELVFSRVVVPILAGATAVCLVLNALGRIQHAFAPYLGGLIFFLFMSSVMFVRLLTAVPSNGPR